MSADPIPIRGGRSRLPRPPAHLGPDGRALWRRVIADFVVDDAAGVELIRLAAEALDRAAQAREILAVEGLTIDGRFGAKTHPAVAIERDSSLRAARLLRELGVTLDPPEQARLPSRWRPS